MTAVSFPNSSFAARQRLSRGQVTWARTLGMLFSRTLLFAAIQFLFFGVFLALGLSDAWGRAVALWPLSATLTNFASIFLLARLARAEGLRLTDIYRGEAHRFWPNLGLAALFLLLAGPIGWLPNVILGNVMFGDQMSAVHMMFRPLPLWLVYAAMALFPLTIGLAELSTYFGYVMPRLEALTGRPWLAVALPALLLAAQHMALPLIFDGVFVAWRLLMFLPLAVYMGLILHWRPRLMPYLMVCHALIDLGTMVTLLMAAQGLL